MLPILISKFLNAMKKFIKLLIFFLLFLIIAYLFSEKMFIKEDITISNISNIKKYFINALVNKLTDSKQYKELDKYKYKEICISIFEKGDIIATHCSNNLNINQDLKHDIKVIANKFSKNSKFSLNRINNYDIYFSILDNKKSESLDSIKALSKAIHTIQIINKKELTIVTHLDQVMNDMSIKDIIANYCKNPRLKDLCFKKNILKFYSYKTKTFLYKNNIFTEIVRNNSKAKIDSLLSKNDIYHILINADNWKSNNTYENGLIEYYYYPSINYSESKINHIRQISSQLSSLRLKRYLKINDLSEIKKAIDYYDRYLICKDNNCYLSISENNSLNLSVFYYFLLKEYDENLYFDKVNKLKNGILLHINEDGSIYSDLSKKSFDDSGIAPGEGMLALIDFYKTSKNEEFLKKYDKSFDYYQNLWKKTHFFFIHWFSQSLHIAYDLTKNPKYINLLFSMNNWIIETYLIMDSKYVEEIGSIGKNQPQNFAAVIGEGLLDAYKLAFDLQQVERANYYKNAILKISKFISLLQYDEISSTCFNNQEKIIGGFRSGLDSNAISNDFFLHIVNFYLRLSDYSIYNKQRF